MSNRIIQTLKEAGFALLLPAFTLLMKADCFKRLVNSFEDPSRNLLTKCAYNLHWRYWRRRTYRPDAYKTFQKEYWETIGMQRWSDKDIFDYSDFERIVSDNIADTDRTLVDLGCGGGHNLAFVTKRFPTVQTYGIDASEGMCSKARERSPHSQIECGFVGPAAPKLPVARFDVVIARSMLTYVDEGDIDIVLSWIFAVASRLVIMSDPSGLLDDRRSSNMVRVTDRTWKRLHDQTHVRDYPEYVKRLRVPFALQQDIVSRGKEQRTCVFVRTVVSDLGR